MRQPFWGELHTHSAVSDGNGSLEDCFASEGRRQELRLTPADILARFALTHLEPVPYTTDGAQWRKMETLAKIKVHHLGGVVSRHADKENDTTNA